MSFFTSKWFFGKSNDQPSPQTRRSRTKNARLGIELLETREMMAAGLWAALTDGVLSIVGTDDSDVIQVHQTDGRVSVSGLHDSYEATQIRLIQVNGGAGNDFIDLNSGAIAGQQPIAIPSILRGGPGDDCIVGGAGNDRLYGDLGNDVLKGGDGGDWIEGGAGDDMLDGGAGEDFGVDDQGQNSLVSPSDFSHLHIESAADGTLYRLGSDGQLKKHTSSAGWAMTSENIIKFALASDGSCYSLGRDGWININGAKAWGGYKDFWFDANYTLYMVGTTGHFERKPAGASWQTNITFPTTSCALCATTATRTTPSTPPCPTET